MTGPHKMAAGGLLTLLILAAVFVWIEANTPFPTADLIKGIAAR